MWDNPRVLNMAAGVMVGLAVLAFALVGVQLLLRSELFPVRQLELKSTLQHTKRTEIEAVLAERIGGNFFAVRLAEVRAGLERLPWVRRVAVRRVWPDTLEVSIEEHVALARWGDDALVNTYGERFQASSDAQLPLFVAPAGTEGEITRRYARFAELLTPLGTSLERVVLTPRLAWQLKLHSGLNILLGRDADAAEGRLRRFVSAYDTTLAKIARRHEYVDLRYPNGFALRIPELRG
jgi:cell division protein FtsQ